MPGPQRKSPWGEEVGERLALAIEKSFSQRRFGEKVGRSVSVVSLWISGAIPEAWDRLRHVCDTAGVSADWLLGTTGTERHVTAPVTPPKEGEWTLLPRVSNAVAAGAERLDPNDITERDWFSFRAGYVAHLIGKGDPQPGVRLMLVTVSRKRDGESMMPTILPGALLMIDRGPGGLGVVEPEDGKIYLCRPPDEDGVTVKRVFRAGKQALMLWPDNPLHKPVPVDMKDRRMQDIVLARVRWIGQEEG